MNFKRIIRDLKKGRQKALQELYSHYGRYFFGIALRYSQDTQEAEDLVQETFMKIFQNIEKFDDRGSFEGWMKRIHINHCLNGMKRRKPVFSLDEQPEVDNTEDTSGFASIIGGLSVEEIVRCIQLLPDGYRAILNLYVFESYSHQEIAQELGINESTSRSQLSKARVKLKQIFEEQGIVYEQAS